MVGEHTHSLVVLRDGVLDLYLYVNLAVVHHGGSSLTAVPRVGCGRNALHLPPEFRHHPRIGELLSIDTNAGTVLTLLGSEIRKEILHRPFTPGLELLQKLRCQP